MLSKENIIKLFVKIPLLIMGAAKFYGRTTKEYMKYGLGKVYGTSGTLEYAADYYSYNRLGYMMKYDGSRFYYKYSFPW